MSGFLRIQQLVVDWSPVAVGSPETTALFNIKTGTRVIAASAELLTAAAGATTSTASLGDASSTAGYVTTSTNGTAGTLDLESSTVGGLVQGIGALLLASLGKLYTADTAVNVTYAIGTPGATNPRVRFRIYTIREK